MRATSAAWTAAAGVASVALVAALTFVRVIGFGFVYDDHWTIVHNRWLAGPLAPVLRRCAAGTARAAEIPDGSRPAMIASTWVDRHLFGLSPTGYHAHSLALYALVAAVACLVLFAVGRRRRAALFGGLFFAVAPLHAEVVAAVNYREDLIAALGVLVPLLFLFRPRARADSAVAATLVALAWLVGLLAKENAIVLLPLAAAVAVLQQKRRAWLAARERTLVALASVLLLWGNWRIALRFTLADDVPRAPPGTLLGLLLATARTEVRAVVDSLLPIFWSPEHAREGAASAVWAIALVALAMAVVLLAREGKTRTPAIGLTLSLLGALPTSALAAPINEQADRYLFLSVLGGAMVWGWALDRLTRVLPRAALPLPVAAVIVPLALVAQRAIVPWESDIFLWRAATERAPASPRAWAGLSRAYRLAGDLDTADRAVERALDLGPEFPPAHLTRAYNALARGDHELAASEIELVEALAGRHFPGVRKAEECAALSVEEAKVCANAP